MADCRYRFTFAAVTNSDLSVDFTNNGGQTWTAVSNSNYLTVNPGDTFSVVLNGPTGWSLTGTVPIIITRGNGAASRQIYSPFTSGYVFYDIGGSMNGTQWMAQVSSIASNPGNGNRSKFEITVAFNANIPNLGNCYFSEDPEIDVIGN
jgi:hypothetical protein